MRVILRRDRDPHLDLALDEAMLLLASRGESPSTLRAGEICYRAVVLGTGSNMERELEPGIDMTLLRRISGGCAVVLGPGMIAYSAVLRLDEFPDAASIRGGYEFVIGRVAAALRELQVDARMRAKSDVASGELKLSGNSQARKRNAVLVHGTVLVEEPPSMEGILRHPPEEPDYRAGRRHAEFLGYVRKSHPSLSCECVREALARAFPGETGAVSAEELELADKLATEKYRNHEWTRKGRRPESR